ncbi:class I SAM-dependent methyltransferase [Metapseudomonas otitidis]|uniref:class I SAM-dependent methyltransferase n=1 Tax=Metapseudomonas otitidis TaxID=319939 RepID=UPI00197CC4A1|nr:class I SAM-dependent methyltransferase [Pseudomonas otitidis]
MIKLVTRTVDVVTGSAELEDLHTLSDFPVFMGVVEHSVEQDLVADMSWSISRTSGLIQLKKLLPLDVLYQAQTTTSAVGATWMAHHREFAKFIAKYSPTGVLEFGGAHGILSIEYQNFGDVPWTILEPNPSPADGCRAEFIKGFFDERFKFDKEFDVLVHSHVFEHLYEPAGFMRAVKEFLPLGQKMLFSVPDLSEWLKRKYTNCINFEHTVYLTEPYVEYLMAEYGFRVLEKQKVMDGHSIFYAVVRDDSVARYELSGELYAENSKVYREFVGYYEALAAELNEKLKGWDGEIYLFGAHVFSQYLIAFGLDVSNVVSLLDNDSRKQGKRLYGTELNVASPEVLRGKKNVAVILKAGIYNEEIKQGISSEINDAVVYF